MAMILQNQLVELVHKTSDFSSTNKFRVRFSVHRSFKGRENQMIFVFELLMFKLTFRFGCLGYTIGKI